MGTTHEKKQKKRKQLPILFLWDYPLAETFWSTKVKIFWKTPKIMWYNKTIVISFQPRQACANSTFFGGLVGCFFFFLISEWHTEWHSRNSENETIYKAPVVVHYWSFRTNVNIGLLLQVQGVWMWSSFGVILGFLLFFSSYFYYYSIILINF